MIQNTEKAKVRFGAVLVAEVRAVLNLVYLRIFLLKDINSHLRHPWNPLLCIWYGANGQHCLANGVYNGNVENGLEFS